MRSAALAFQAIRPRVSISSWTPPSASLPHLPTHQRRQQTSNSNKSSTSLASGNNDTNDLIDLAKTFINNKNAAGSGKSTLDGVFDMCSPTVDLYGLKGEDVRPGFTSFFESHPNLYHELLDEPTVIGEGTVQYSFIKRWRRDVDESEENGDGNYEIWKSIDPTKPRNKVERLWFDDNGKLEKVSVVEADAPLDLN